LNEEATHAGGLFAFRAAITAGRYLLATR